MWWNLPHACCSGSHHTVEQEGGGSLDPLNRPAIRQATLWPPRGDSESKPSCASLFYSDLSTWQCQLICVSEILFDQGIVHSFPNCRLLHHLGGGGMNDKVESWHGSWSGQDWRVASSFAAWEYWPIMSHPKPGHKESRVATRVGQDKLERSRGNRVKTKTKY